MKHISLRDVATHWDQNADQWAEDVRNGYDTYREYFTLPAFRAFLPNLQGLEVIDFGCGEGGNSRHFAKMGAKVTGIDLSEGMLAHARHEEAQRPLSIRYLQGSFCNETELAEGSFDAVLSTMALMDGPDLDGAMNEAYRLLKPGGFLAFSILHPCFIIPGVQWKPANDQQDAIGFGQARYFARESFVENWKFGCRPKLDAVAPFAVPRFPRTMADYINAIAKAGFRLSRMEEPRPSEEACAIVPRLVRWRDLVAFLLLVEARKD